MPYVRRMLPGGMRRRRMTGGRGMRRRRMFHVNGRRNKQVGLGNCLGCGAKVMMKCIQHILDPMKKIECVMGEIESSETKESCKQCLCDIVCRMSKGGKLTFI